MDRLKREGNPPVGQLASPIPQYKRPGSTDYEAVEGQHGAPFAILKDASGNVVSPATDAKLEQVKSELELVKAELQEIKANQLSGDQKVQLSGTISEVLGGIISSVTPGSTLTLIETRTSIGALRTLMVLSGNGTRYSLELRLYGKTSSSYALKNLAENKAGSNTFDVYDLDIVVPRYSLRFTNTGTIDAYLIWSAVEV